MKRHNCGAWCLLGGLGLVLLAAGCKHGSPDYYLPNAYGEKLPATTGSIGEASRKQAAKEDLAKSKKDAKARAKAASPVMLLVAHDATGKPVGAEVRQSSGDPDFDARARDLVLKKWKFPVGRANTLVVTVEPKMVPVK